MVRTKADNSARKAVAAKAPRKNLGVSSTAMKAGNTKSPAGKRAKFGGGNSICPRATPEWQKEITNFMIRSPRSQKQKENVNPDDDDDDDDDDVDDEEETSGAGCSNGSRLAEAQGSSSRIDKTAQGTKEENEEEDIEEEDIEEEDIEEEDIEEESEEPSATSSKRKFKKNNCISDSEDDE